MQTHNTTVHGILQLLLGAKVVGVSTLPLVAVGGTRVKASVALSANHLVTVVLLGQNAHSWLENTTA